MNLSQIFSSIQIWGYIDFYGMNMWDFIELGGSAVISSFYYVAYFLPVLLKSRTIEKQNITFSGTCKAFREAALERPPRLNLQSVAFHIDEVFFSSHFTK